MSIYKIRKEMIFNKIKESNITDNDWEIKRMTGIILKFAPTDEELEKGLVIIQNGLNRYLVNSLEGFTYKTFKEISKR